MDRQARNRSAFSSSRSSHVDGGLGCVLMVYGLNPDRMNCDRLFNLFCLYGNVIKVSFISISSNQHFLNLPGLLNFENSSTLQF